MSDVLPTAPLLAVVIDDTKCPKCSTVNPIDANYCEVCGEKLSEKNKVCKRTSTKFPSCKGMN